MHTLSYHGEKQHTIYRSYHYRVYIAEVRSSAEAYQQQRPFTRRQFFPFQHIKQGDELPDAGEAEQEIHFIVLELHQVANKGLRPYDDQYEQVTVDTPMRKQTPAEMKCEQHIAERKPARASVMKY